MNNGDESERLRRKRQFYDELEKIQSSDGEQDTAYETARRLMSDGLKKRKQSRSGAAGAKPPTVATKNATQPEKSVTAATIPSGPPNSAIPRLKSKGKAEAIKLVPEAQRIFAGLHFYFFPNNDANLARRFRIIKAIEYGASWQREWNSFVTHIITDKEVKYGTLLTQLQVQVLPAHVVLVNESWPAECLAFRTLVDSTRPSFTVIGAPTHAKQTEPELPPATASAEQATPSDTSLVLKPPGNAVQAKPPSTQRSSPPEVQHDRGVLENDNLLATQDESSSDLPPEFQEAISQARDLASLPLEELESSHTGDTTDSPPSTQSPILARSKKVLTHQDRFQCMQPHTGKEDTSPNAEIIHILQQMADYYQQTGDEWRTRAYRKATGTIRIHKEKITTKEQAFALPNVGERLAEKIEEIAFTHRLRRLDAAQAEPTDQTKSLFMSIYGVGYVQASNWVRKGYRSIEELVQKEKLTYAQKVGVYHFEDFQLRIPRTEVKQHADMVLQALQQADAAFTLIIGGSYRRGSPDSSDVDCVITHPSFDLDKMRALLTDQVIPSLKDADFIKAELSVFTRDEGSKWLGASCLPGASVWRRMDFLLVPDDEIGAAMIYFTGNDIFNRSMRLLANKKGMRLNQRGLYKDVIRAKGNNRMTDGTLIEGRDERKIFEILGVPWREPWERLI